MKVIMLLEVKNLKTHFFTDAGVLKAVDGISFSLEKGKTLGIVGESGCGKSITALSIMRLIQRPGKIVDGEVFFQLTDIGRPVDLLKLSNKEMRKVRGKKIAMIFQEPMTSLNPVFTIGNQIAEALLIHEKMSKRAIRERSIEMLKLVKMPEPEKRVDEYPHQLSGGMRQRVMIAMALSCNPEILIADEPTTALDVTIQAQILELITELQEKLNMAVIMITHDFGVVAEVADDIMVMYAGKVVEHAKAGQLFTSPSHPYTQNLLKS
ncbi:ABC transporter ATP-binding protein, partial [bacterium]|nr:ABC transporter ATP-binding protein [bacterium]